MDLPVCEKHTWASDTGCNMLSAYVLTFNSERYLAGVLQRLARVADDIVVLDSGSTDSTLAIAHAAGARVSFRQFDDFIQQREFAAQLCAHDWILFVDSDELMDDDLIDEINRMKAEGFDRLGHDGFHIRREWYVLGKRVRGIYPVQCPDSCIRLYNRQSGYFDKRIPVHEDMVGLAAAGFVRRGAIHHYTFETREDFDVKLQRYAPLAIEAMVRRGKRPSSVAWAHAVGAFLKWFLVYQCWRDGRVGLTCSMYAFRYTRAKYQGLRRKQEAIAAAAGTVD